MASTQAAGQERSAGTHGARWRRRGLRRLGLRRLWVLAVAAGLTVAAVATSAPATAAPGASALPTLRGTTEVTTAPGIARTLLGAGILPLPVASTSFRLGYSGGLNVTYGFPITKGNPNLAGPSGDILHGGGINFVSFRGTLEIGKFDIDLAAGTIFATEVNYRPQRLPVLGLDLSRLVVSSRPGATVLSGIGLTLEPAAATALNSTFGLRLPADGSLRFGTGTVTIRS